MELDQKINRAIAKAIKDYGRIAKLKRVSLKTLKCMHMQYGLCYYFRRNYKLP